jgi:formate hydrogenlyase subunit 3/multisubunit Na+/H+ antiporter MnhD subunit
MMPTVETSLSLLLLPILIPLVTGVLSFLIRRLRNEIAIAGSLITFYFALRIFILSRYGIIVHDYASIGPVNIGLHVDGLSAFVLLASAFLGLMAIIYSRRAMRESPGVGSYYLFIMFTIACANGVFMASDMLIVVFFWGFLAATLYGMLFLSKKDSSVVAMKGFFIAATADLLLMTGIGILLFNLGDSGIAPATRIPLTSGLAIASFFLLTAGALAKAGSMPFHTWIPDAAGTAPATFLGFIPGAIDKLLGIYLNQHGGPKCHNGRRCFNNYGGSNDGVSAKRSIPFIVFSCHFTSRLYGAWYRYWKSDWHCRRFIPYGEPCYL